MIGTVVELTVTIHALLLCSLKVTGSKKACGCAASLCIRIKKDSKHGRYHDDYAKRGLLGVITINNTHNHLLQNADAQHWLKRDTRTVAAFTEYFNTGTPNCYRGSEDEQGYYY